MLTILAACGPVEIDGDEVDVEPVDQRVSEDDIGGLADDQILLMGPDAVIEPGTDVMICLFDTYEGEDVGLHDVHTWQGQGGHHLQVMGTSTPAIDVPDGTVVDCTGDGGQFQMTDLQPVGVTNGGTVGGEPIGVSMPLPDGMAFDLENGQRFVMQAHYINTGVDPIRVRDLAVLTLIPADEVVTWAAPLIFNRDDFEVAPGEALTTSFPCTTPADWNFLYVLGHMHEWGTSFAIERLGAEGATPFYEIPEWDPVYRDAPVIDYYPDDSMPVPAGTSFQTTCSWSNDQDEPLVFPHEMCVGLNIVYPQKTTVICDGNGS
jgi:hypothetical protein